MTRPLVKICGIRRPEDGVAAVEAGADFIGLVFASESKRAVDAYQAALVVEAVRKLDTPVGIVGVFVNEEPTLIGRTAQRVGLDLIQFHGDETPELIALVDRPSIKAVRVGKRMPEIDPDLECDWILYDTWTTESRGGTGRTFDWTLLANHSSRRPFFLSGGLDPDNVMRAVEVADPDAIDVSSGVEDEPGIKNHQKIERVIRQVKG